MNEKLQTYAALNCTETHEMMQGRDPLDVTMREEKHATIVEDL